MTEFLCSTSNKFFPRVRGTISERFWSKVMPEPNTGCWIWCGDTNGSYGSMGVKRGGSFKRDYAHRISWRLHKGSIPEGFQIDHICRNRLCVNPEHLDVVTPKENVQRALVANGGTFHKGHKTHCKNGHIRSPETTRIITYKNWTWHQCLICQKAAQIRHSERRKKRRLGR